MGKEQEPITIGYKYFMGMHLAVCHAPDVELRKITAGERVAWEGSVSTNSTIFINKPELFGGDKKEGGIQGHLDVETGLHTQGQNAYLASHQGANTPAYRGVFCLVLKRMYLIAMNKYPKKWAITVRRPAGKDWYEAKSIINGGANGAHIIYEALTNADYGLGLSPGFINNTSFISVADTLYDENLGLSLILNKQMPIEKFIQSILTHISGVLYVNKSFGTFVLKLIRKPTSGEIAIATHFNESNTVELNSFERPSFAEMINEVVLKYKPQGEIKDSTITVHDLASVQAQGGVVSQTVSFIGIDTKENAAIIALRELRQYSTPLAKLRLVVNREAWDINPGDIATFTWDKYGITDMVLRILSIDYGTLTRGTITLDCTEDIYALPDSSYLSVQQTAWVDPIKNPQPLVLSGVYELPFYDINTRFSVDRKQEVDQLSAYLMVLPVNNQSISPGLDMWTSPTSIESNYKFDVTGNYTPTAILNADLFKPITASLTETIVIASLVGFVENVQPGSYAFLNNEIIEVVSIDMVTLEMVIKRGLLDTVPQDHLLGDRIYFAERSRIISRTEYLANPVNNTGSSVYIRHLIKTDIAELAIANAPTFNTSFVGRQSKPYPPRNARINLQYHPVSLSQDGRISVGKVFDTPVIFNKIKLIAGASATEMIKGFELQYTDDVITNQTEFANANWTTVLSKNNETGWALNEERTYDL